MNLLRKTLILLSFAVVLAVLLGGTSAVQRRMNDIREREKLTETQPLENAPPMVAFTTVALGAFRGLVADWLWLRLNRMQDQGNYFEMVQLASWIVKLQPRFTGATAFLAWNMAYNISVTFSNPEDRWRWVQRGIELIRDEALLYNPGDPELFKELGWIYQHKLGQDLDDANRYYKRELALSMMHVLGGYPPDWQALASAPDTLTELRARLGTDAELWGILAGQGMDMAEVETHFRAENAFPDSLVQPLRDAGVAETVEMYVRKRWLQEEYKLDAERILELNQQYGPLDWRLPQAHAVYWASRGLEVAEGELSRSCDRMIFQALNQAFQSGRVVYVEEAEYIEFTPNVALVDAVNDAYLRAGEKHTEQIMKAGYENFLVDAVVLLYTFGKRSTAREYMAKGKDRYGKRFAKPLDRFVLDELAQDLEAATSAQGHAAVQGYLLQMCNSLAIGDVERASAFDDLARRIWLKYMDQIGKTTRERRGLPPYKTMKRNTVERCLQIFPPALEQNLRRQLPEDLARELEAQAEPPGDGEPSEPAQSAP